LNRYKRIKSVLTMSQILFVFFVIQIISVKVEGQTDKFETNRDTILAEMKHLLNQSFELWYPLSIDSADGGFYSDINYKW
jgi:hypothetical protein